MERYRLYRLDVTNQIIDAIDFHAACDEDAVSEAVRIDHAAMVEIWCKARLVARVDPKPASR